MAKKIITNLHDMVSSTAEAYIFANKEEFKSETPGPQGPRGFRGNDGVDGVGVEITSILNNPNKSLTINFSDGTQHTTDPLKGQDGTSVTVTNVVNNPNGTMQINFSDGTSHTTANLTGPRGFKGDTGDHVHHISYQRSKDALGNEVGPVTPSQRGYTDTYAMWLGQEELPEMYIGEFTVFNGLDTLTTEERYKFDSIEFGATGDQTANEILTLLKTVDGSGSGIDADLLDGQEGAYYLNASNINTGTINDSYLPNTITSDITGNAATATKLSTSRTISLTGDVTGNVSFDGSTNINISTTIQPNSVALGTDTTGNYVNNVIAGAGITVTGTAGEGWSPTVAIAPVGTVGTYTKVTTNDKGQVVTGTILAASDIPSLDASKITSGIIDAARLPAYVDNVLEYANLSAFPAVGESGKIYIALDTNKAYRWSGSTYVYITSVAVDSVAGKTGVVTLVKADVGLSNVDNTSDINKPISTATQIALNSKVDKVAGKGLSTEDYSTAEKSKLAGIAAGAQVNVATDLSLGTATATVLPLNSSTGNDVNLPSATTTTAGLLSATDKTKLNGLSNYVKPVNEPISYITGLQTALDGKASTTYVDGKFTDLIGAAPAALDTLKEIADQLANDESVVSALTTAVSNKANTTDVNTALATKVDKVAGKQLSTEDYTTTEKTKLSGLNNYTKPASEPISYITGLQTALDSKVSKTGVEALHSTDALRISGTTLSLYKGDGTFESVVTQDTVYTLPKASATTLGGIKVGSNLSIDANGVLNASASSSISWTNITDKPTNISGYGITDAYTKTEVGTLAEFTTNLG